MNVSAVTISFVRTILLANAGLAEGIAQSQGTPGAAYRLFEAVAPQGSTYPLVIVNWVPPGRYTTALGEDLQDVLIAFSPLVQVQAVSEGNGFGPANDLADLINDAMEGADGYVTYKELSYQLSYINTEQLLRSAELPQGQGGTRYNYVGGRYRLFGSKV